MAELPNLNQPVQGNAQPSTPVAANTFERCGIMYRSQFDDANSRLVYQIHGMPKMFVDANNFVWMDIVALNSEGKPATMRITFDQLKTSASGKSYTFKAMGRNFNVQKDWADKVIRGIARNTYVTSSLITQRAAPATEGQQESSTPSPSPEAA